MNRIKKIVTSLCRALSSALLLMSASYADMVDIGTASFLPHSLEVGHGESAVAFADFDGDGNVDLIVDHRGRGGLLSLRGLGNGAFDAPGTVIGVGGDPYLGLDLGDVNGDGWIDLVTPNPGEVGVLLNAGGGRIAFNSVNSLAATSPFAVALTDINGDSFEDALISSWSSDALIVLGGPGEFRTVRPHLQDVENPWGLAVVDLNEDGKGDFVIADGVRASATVYLSHE